jgi:transporter family-2 protein
MIIAIISGGFVAAQSRINGELGKELGNGYLAALLSFGSGLILLAIAMLFWPAGRRGLARSIAAIRSGSVPWWHFCGGAAGAFFVLSQGLTAALLGVALFTVASVCGQTISGLVIDRNGLGTVLPKPVTYTRLIGSVVAFGAVVWAVSAQLVGTIPIWALAMPFLAGLGIGWQQAVNGQVRGVSESALTATFINFLVGTVVLLVVAVIHGAVAGWPTRLPNAPWLYLGGAIGVVFIATAAILVRTIGVLLLSLGTIAGQLTASLLIDFATPIPGHVIAWTTIAGTVLTLLAVAFAAIPSRAIWRPKVTTER